ncbi:MAG: amidohydrolase [Chloroflexi bacterium]|nr:amidohydrolase [Chloroflexota bacterium]
MDLVFANATVLTLDPSRPRAGLLAVRGGAIAYVGRAEDLPQLQRPGTRVVDCAGGCLLPGFVDAHLHLLGLASRLMAVDCTPQAAPSIPAVGAALAQRAAATPAGGWVRGWGYHETLLAERRHPTRHDLDRAVPHHPVRLSHRSGHAEVLNSMALRLVGITRHTPDPPDGVIARDERGEPTGLLLDMERWLEGRIPHMTVAELEEGVRRANALLLSRGITYLHDATPSNDLARLRTLAQFKASGLLLPRVLFMPGMASLRELCGRERPELPEGMSLGQAKVMLTLTTGALVPSYEGLLAQVREAHALGHGIAVHAVEAEGVEAAARAIAAAGSRPLRQPDRIEHASECPPQILEMVVKSGAAVVTNPLFIHHSGDRYLAEVPPATQPSLYRVGSLARTGVPLAFGSDAPVELPHPLLGIAAAVTRCSAAGRVVGRTEAIDVADALWCHTVGGWWAAGLPGGTVVAGAPADLVLLARDPTQVEPAAIADIPVKMTVVAGKVVWER